MYRAENGKANVTGVAKPELFKLQKHKHPKITVACDPCGAVIFSSALFTGSMSNKEIVRQCGIIPLLEQLIDSDYFQRGDGIMADKGFLIKDEMRAVGLQLNLPPFSRSNRQMPAGDVLVTKRIANC